MSLGQECSSSRYSLHLPITRAFNVLTQTTYGSELGHGILAQRSWREEQIFDKQEEETSCNCESHQRHLGKSSQKDLRSLNNKRYDRLNPLVIEHTQSLEFC